MKAMSLLKTVVLFEKDFVQHNIKKYSLLLHPSYLSQCFPTAYALSPASKYI
jgi:hypothetical protein